MKWPWACKLAGTVKQTGGYNFSKEEQKKKLNSRLLNHAHNSPFYGLDDISRLNKMTQSAHIKQQ